MSDRPWNEAIRIVLTDAPEPMHYKEIAEEVAKRGLRKKLGATPAYSVASVLSTSIASDSKMFVRTGQGYYNLADKQNAIQEKSSDPKREIEEEAGLIQALGMFWRASEVEWKHKPKLLGQQQQGAVTVDFCDQVGVYLLHDVNRVLYVGRSIDRALGVRLSEHTRDRLANRWDRFSWFGLKNVDADGSLSEIHLALSGPAILVATLEAILIEALEPPQNRKRGDDFSALEYLQVSDPATREREASALGTLIAGSIMKNR